MVSKRPGTSASLKALSFPVTQMVQQSKLKPPSPSPLPSALTLKDLQDALEKTVRQIRQETAELFEEKNNEMRKDILLICQRLAAHIERLDECVDKVVENVERFEDRVGKAENNVDIIQNEIIMIQYREMEYALQIRGLKEDLQENLKEKIAADLAFIWGCGPEEISKEIEKFFRVNSRIARQRNLPRDVVIYFSRRSLRNEIIQAFYKQRFQITSQDVIILKEIPSKILRKRKDFDFLTEELKKCQVQFRWDIPVGLVVNYAGTRYRLDTILKARDFYVSVLKADTSSSPRLKRIEQKSEEHLTEGISATGSLQVDSKQQCLEIKDDLKEHRMTRAAYRAKKKEQQKTGMVF